MVTCCGCGRLEESCLCDNNPFPMYMRGPNWKAEKEAYDHVKREKKLNAKSAAIKKEIQELKVKLDKLSGMFNE